MLGNGLVRMVILTGGGHIAEFRFADTSGFPTLNPMWVPPWKTIEPYQYRPRIHASRYGSPTTGGKLLSGLVGHNICMDLFGSPSEEEARLGYPDHGEAPNARWRKTNLSTSALQAALTLSVSLPIAGLELEREIRLRRRESVIYLAETVRNLRKADHFCHWVQHVTLGPPFLSNRDSTVFLPGTKAKTYPHGYEERKALLASDREFSWPLAPAMSGAPANLSRPFLRQGLGFVVGVLLDPRRDVGYIAALNSRHRLLITYCFCRRDFPWVAIWEENKTRAAAPWRKKAQARGLEFGTTPFALSRREAFALGNMFGTPTLACIPAGGQKKLEYVAFLAHLPKDFGEVDDVGFGEREIPLLGTGRRDPLRLPAGGLSASLLRTDAHRACLPETL